MTLLECDLFSILQSYIYLIAFIKEKLILKGLIKSSAKKSNTTFDFWKQTNSIDLDTVGLQDDFFPKRGETINDDQEIRTKTENRKYFLNKICN